MSRYGSVTKHMGIASKNVWSFSSSDLLFILFFNIDRRDHLTAAVLFWNDQKEKGMVYKLIKRRDRVIKAKNICEQLRKL
jgi:hypothetical protein